MLPPDCLKAESERRCAYQLSDHLAEASVTCGHLADTARGIRADQTGQRGTQPRGTLASL